MKLKNTYIYAGVAAIVLVAILIRLSLTSFQSADYDVYLSPWYDHLAVNGWQGLGDAFSNYNLPYLYLLYLASLLSIDKIIAIKLISFVFDFVLAIGIYLVLKHFKPKSPVPLIGAVGSLFLPTVLLNSAVWGQCDVIYTAFIVFSFWAILKKNQLQAWLFWAIAFSFKLQAIFFLPILVYFWLRSLGNSTIKTLVAPLAALAVFFATWIPAIVAGRPVQSIASIYTEQAGGRNLTLNAPNLYQWLPDSSFDIFNKAGILITAAVLIGLFVLFHASRKAKETKLEFTIFTTLILLIIPFLLPQMHERYFYTAEIFVFLLAFLLPFRYTWMVIALQLCAVFSYMPFLLHLTPPVPLNVLPILHIVIIVILIYLLFQNSTRRFK